MSQKPDQPVQLVVGPGASWYQVIEPSKILAGPGGSQQLALHGPFDDLAAASAYANARPGSFIAVTLVLHQVAAYAPPPANLVRK